VGTIRADEDRLRQVLVTLGRNAIEACEREAGTVEVVCTMREREAAFMVTDNGCGIQEEDLPRVFDPFFTRKESGTGLGLALSHKIVAAHGGEIRLESRKGRGTVAWVLLPQLGEIQHDYVH
jgi:signal transduction histidine kinase